MKYAEGIDKIGLLLNPLFLVEDKMHEFFDPYRKVTKHRAGQFWIISIHDEYFNPFLDYQVQIAFVLYELVKKGVFNFPDTPFTPYFIFKNPEYFMLSITAIEFYSDCKEENFILEKDMVKPTIDEAENEGCIFQYYDKKTETLTDTYYSSDYNTNRKSFFIIYDKLKKSKRDRNIASYEELERTQNPIRLEFRIYSNNSKWLHWDNLKGTYYDIFKRYKKYLATIYNNHLSGYFTVKGNENLHFREIVKTAKKDQNVRNRNKGQKLKQSSSKSNEELYPMKHLTADQVSEKQDKIIALLEPMSRKNGIKDEVVRMIEIAGKCGWNYGKSKSVVEKNGKMME